jgi:hypothetical protein
MILNPEGRKKGSAIVVFERTEDARTAIGSLYA